jgi:hypothetical protein
MCNVDFNFDPPTVFRTEVRTSRKVRRCDECSRTVVAGEIYENTFMVYDGGVSTFSTCSHCLVARQWMLRECGGSLYGAGGEDGGLMHEMREHALEYPSAAFGLWRLYSGMKRSWQRFDGGGLMPIPQPPPSVHGHLS